MYQHRLVPDGARGHTVHSGFCQDSLAYYSEATIPMPSEWTAEQLVVLAGITPEEWNTIFGYFIANEVIRAGYAGVAENTLRFETRGGKSFSDYLSTLISLAPLKGLTVEDMKKLL